MVGAVACAVTLAVAVAVALAGCAVLGPATSPRAQPVPRHAIRIDGWDGFEQTLLYHDALVFVDAEADKAAREDGHEGGAPNPIWIRDLPSRGQLAIDPNVSVILVGLDATGSRVPKLVPVELLLALLQGRDVPSEWSLPGLAYVVVEDGRITELEEVMTP